MAADRFGPEQTRERLAILEVEVKHVVETIDDLQGSVAKLDGKVEGLTRAFHELRLELAKKRSTPPPSGGWSVPKATQQALGGVIGAVLLYVAAALGFPMPSQPPKEPKEPTAQATQQTHEGP